MGAITSIFSGLGFGLFQTGLNSYQSYANAKIQRQAGEMNALTYENNAQLAVLQAGQQRAAGEQEYKDVIREYGRLAGDQRAAYGASGVSVNAGSPLAVTANTAAEGVYEAQKTRHQREINAWQLENQAANYRFEAAKSRAGVSGVNPALAGITTAVGGISNTYNKYDSWRRS